MKNLNLTIVGGTFDYGTGKPSHFVSKLATILNCKNVINGGNISIIDNFKPDVDILLWMPNISNDIQNKKLLKLKEYNPKMILIQSKRVIEKDYTDSDIIGRLLQSHSQLGIVIGKAQNSYRFKLLDPLGNIWEDTSDINQLGIQLLKRLNYLTSLTRTHSYRDKNFENNYSLEPDFIKVIQDFGNEFTKHVNAINPNRLLGNASTRCAKGFPSVRVGENLMLVTKRNVDKKTLSSEDFVLVESQKDDITRIKFSGFNKPSLDTGIQLLMYSFYPIRRKTSL